MTDKLDRHTIRACDAQCLCWHLQLKKKVRVRKAGDEEGTGLDLAALEAEAAAAGKSELGSRKEAAGRAAKVQAAQIADEAQRLAKYVLADCRCFATCCHGVGPICYQAKWLKQWQ